MLEDRAPLLPMAFWALSLSERAGRPDLVMMNQAGLGTILTAAGHERLARPHVRAAVAAAERPATRWPSSGPTSWPACTGWPWATGRPWSRAAAGPGGREPGPPAPHGRPGGPARGGRPLPERPLRGAAALATDAARRRSRPPRPDGRAVGAVLQAEARLRSDPGDPDLAAALEEGRRCPRPGSRRSTPSASRWPWPATTWPPGAGRRLAVVRAAAALAGPEPSFHPYTLEAHAGIPRSAWPCWRVRAPGVPTRPSCGPRPAWPAPAGALRPHHPHGPPRARLCQGAWQELEGRRRAALRSWARAVEAAERLAMPWELASGQLQLGRHLGPGERAPDGPGRGRPPGTGRGRLRGHGLPPRVPGRVALKRSRRRGRSVVAGVVVSVNVRNPQGGRVPAGTWCGQAIWKDPVAGGSRSRHKVEGDEQGNPEVHGGPDKAVYAYAGPRTTSGGAPSWAWSWARGPSGTT
jgi:hypothetical protein